MIKTRCPVAASEASPARGGLLATGAVLCAFAVLDAVLAITVSAGVMREAVVVDKNPQALRSPFAGAGAQPGFVPAPGQTVRMEKAFHDFLLVSDQAGHTGWMASNELAPVVK